MIARKTPTGTGKSPTESARAESVDVVWDQGTMVPRSVETGIYSYRAGQLIASEELTLPGLETKSQVRGLGNEPIAYIHRLTELAEHPNKGPRVPALIEQLAKDHVASHVHHVCGITPYYMISEGDPLPVGESAFAAHRSRIRRRVESAFPEGAGGGSGSAEKPMIAIIDTGYLFSDAGSLECEVTIDGDDVLHTHLDPSSDHPLVDTGSSEEPYELLERAAGHGVFVASVVSHVAKDLKLRFERVTGGVDGVVDEEIVCQQIIDAAAAGADVINLSLGCYGRNDEEPFLLKATLAHVLAERPELMVVAAAGNDSSARRFFPAAFTDDGSGAFDRLISVGALDGPREAGYSNAGLWVRWYAPGTDVVGRYLGSSKRVVERRNIGDGLDVPFAGFAKWSGTSYAAPYVSGLIARMMVDRGIESAVDAWRDLANEPIDRRRRLRLMRGDEI